MSNQYVELADLLNRMQEVAEKEHNTADMEERAYFQGCKDTIRKVLALIVPDSSWIGVINSSPWVISQGHRNLLEAMGEANIDESEVMQSHNNN